MNLQSVTVQDCMDMCRYKNKMVLISDGKILGFEHPSEDDIKALANAMRKVRVNRLKKWLSRLAANFKEQQKLKNFVEDESILAGCVCFDKGVYLYKGLRTVAENLIIPIEGRVVETREYGKKLKLSFIWDGVEFFGWEDFDNAGSG